MTVCHCWAPSSLWSGTDESFALTWPFCPCYLRNQDFPISCETFRANNGLSCISLSQVCCCRFDFSTWWKCSLAYNQIHAFNKCMPKRVLFNDEFIKTQTLLCFSATAVGELWNRMYDTQMEENVYFNEDTFIGRAQSYLKNEFMLKISHCL